MQLQLGSETLVSFEIAVFPPPLLHEVKCCDSSMAWQGALSLWQRLEVGPRVASHARVPCTCPSTLPQASEMLVS